MNKKEIKKEKSERHKNSFFSKCLLRHDVLRVFCVVLCVGLCTRHFFMVPLNLTYLHCLQHSFFEHLFNLCYCLLYASCNLIKRVDIF